MVSFPIRRSPKQKVVCRLIVMPLDLSSELHPPFTDGGGNVGLEYIWVTILFPEVYTKVPRYSTPSVE